MEAEAVANLAPLMMMVIIAMLIYGGVTGKNPFAQAVGGLYTGPFNAFKSIFQDIGQSQRCDDPALPANQRYTCMKKAIQYCTTGVGNISGPQNTACFTDRGVPLSKNNKSWCLLPPNKDGKIYDVCPSWPDDVPCSAWERQVFPYNTEPVGTVAGGTQYKCGQDVLGGEKCKKGCCVHQRQYCSGPTACFGKTGLAADCYKKCLAERGCKP